VGNPAGDQFADLVGRFQARRDDYLMRLTTDDSTIASDPEKFATAKRRGFLKGRGPRPTCSLADQDAAGEAARNNLVVWTDSPCIRAGVPEAWDSEDVQSVIARLWRITDAGAFRTSLVIPEEPLAEHGRAPGFRKLLRLCRELALLGRADFRNRIRALLAQAVDQATTLPDYNPWPPFDPRLVERVVEALNTDDDPSGPSDEVLGLAYELITRRVEGQTDHITLADAQRLLKGLAAVLPTDVAMALVQAALDNAHPGPYNAPSHAGWEPSPSEGPPRPSFGGREPPGPFGAREQPPAFGAREDPGSTREKPPGTFEDPNPDPPPPRGEDTLLSGAWTALSTLGWFGDLVIDGDVDVRHGVLLFAAWWRNDNGDIPSDVDDRGRTSLVEELFADTVWVPPPSDTAGYEDFVWPPYTAEGIYWWRTVIQPACINHLYQLADTADFKTTDLIRLVRLFPAHDRRIPDYVRTAIKLGLLWFKYWWDEPPAKNTKGEDQAEMTMWSENHQILFAQSQLLAGELFRDLEFARSQFADTGNARTGQDHIKEGLTRVERWLDLRLRCGFSEWNAPGYYNEDFPPLFNLVDFCDPDDPGVKDQDERAALARIRTKAAMVLDVMIFDLARFTCRGSFGATAGRAYWEHKCYGWEQSVGDTIELLFGTRGDFMGSEPAAVALATSTYQVPPALLGVGLDRVLVDQQLPLTDHTRVSLDFDNAARFNIGLDSEEDVLFWWGLEAYYTDKTLGSTKRVVAAHDNLRLCDPFKPLYALPTGLAGALIELMSIAVDVLNVGAAAAVVLVVPFPYNVIWAIVDADNIVEATGDFFRDVWEYLKLINKAGPAEGAAAGAAGGFLVGGVGGAIVGGAVGFFVGLAGGGASDKPQIPDSALQDLLEKLLVALSSGTVLSTAHITTYNNGDAMLSSVQNHQPGEMTFQKQPWMANLGCDACVWTTARIMAPDVGSYLSSWSEMFKDLGLLRFHDALADVAMPPALQVAVDPSDLLGHNGPNYWTGSLTLPMVVQHDNAAIIAYDLPALQRSISGFSTHAWFPKDRFDDAHKVDAGDGTWFFGRKVHAIDGQPGGAGFVALFSATKADWTDEDGNAWNNKEIKTDPPGANVLKGSNIWICVVSSEAQYADAGTGKEYDTFCSEILSAYLHVSGVGSPYQLQCSFDVPRAKSPPGKSPRLELFYDDRQGKFAGDPVPMKDFRRFENRYIPFPDSGAFGTSRYDIVHPPTGLKLTHDFNHADQPKRTFTRQDELERKLGAPAPRLVDGGLKPVRRPVVRARRTRPVTHPRLDVSSIRRRTP
jgi:hypothetical protein